VSECYQRTNKQRIGVPFCDLPQVVFKTSRSYAFLASAELAVIASKLGHIPTVAESFDAMGIVSKDCAACYKYLSFNQIQEHAENAKGVKA
jgi:aconitase B